MRALYVCVSVLIRCVCVQAIEERTGSDGSHVTGTGRCTVQAGALLAQQLALKASLAGQTVARQGRRLTLVSLRQGIQTQLLLNGTGKACSTGLQCRK